MTFFSKKAIPNFEEVGKPGQLDPNKWIPGHQAGYANAIGYYDHDTGLDMKHRWRWLTKKEKNFIFPVWGYMSEMCTNIQQAVTKSWRDDILNELCTGPIDWPANWKDDLPPELISSAGTASPEKPERVPAGKENPRTGWWFTPAKANSRRYFKQGDVFPAIENGAYGDTFWQWHRIGPRPLFNRKLGDPVERFAAPAVLLESPARSPSAPPPTASSPSPASSCI